MNYQLEEVDRIVAAVNAQSEQQSTPTPPTDTTISPSALAEGRRLTELARGGNPLLHLVNWQRWVSDHLPSLLSAADRLSQVEARIRAVHTFDDPEAVGACISDIDQIVKGAR